MRECRHTTKHFGALRSRGARAIPVSYTHLDVYKRQVYMLRAVQLWSRVSKKIKLRFLLSSLIVFFCALLLALSWVDYSSNGAFVRDWRQLYYVVIFSAFFLTFLTPYASVVFSRNRHDTDYSRQKKTSLLIASTLLIITPILCAFSVHGLILIVLTSITLLIPYLVISNISICLLYTSRCV